MHSTLLAKRHLSQIMCFCLLANLISARSVQWFEINWQLIINYQLFHQSPTNRDRLLLSVIARQLFIKGFHHRWGRENHWYCPALILLYPLLEHVPGLFLRPGAFENSTAQWVVDSSSFFEQSAIKIFMHLYVVAPSKQVPELFLPMFLC